MRDFWIYILHLFPTYITSKMVNKNYKFCDLISCLIPLFIAYIMDLTIVFYLFYLFSIELETN